jgi:Co/Zn/Cd efflux system component
VAAAAVLALDAAWPDTVVAAVIALIFLRSAIRILGEALPQFRNTSP